MKKRVIIGACIIAVLLCMVGIALYTSNQPVHIVDPTTPPERYYAIGDTVVIDDIALTVLHAGIFENSEYYGIERGYRLYGVYIKVSNITEEQVYFDDCGLTTYSNGVLCESYLFVDDAIGSFYLDGNQNRYGWLYYIVPKNAKNISVEYTYDALSDSKIIFKVK